MKINLNLKTSVHIGDGGEVYAYEYIFDKNKKSLYIYDFKGIVDILFEIYGNINLKWVKEKFFIQEKNKEKLKNLKDILESCGYFIDFKTFNGIIRIKNKEIKPIYRLYSLTNYIKYKIKTYIKSLNKAYIPGSEIKGALRTAFLYYLFKNYLLIDNNFYRNFQNEIREYIEGKKDLKKLNPYDEFIQNKFFRDGSKNVSEDFFKFISISDSYERKSPEDILYVVNVEIFNSSKSGESAEVLKENSLWSFDFEVDIKKLLYLINQVKVSKNSYKIIRKEIKDFSNLNSRSFLTLTKEFYLDLIDFEIWYWREGYKAFQKKFEENSNKDILKEKSLEKIRNDILNFYINLKKELQENKNIFPIRIGKYINRYSHVILLALWMKAIREGDKDCKELLNLAIRRYKNPFSFKTRRYFYKETEQKYLPFGWAYIYI